MYEKLITLPKFYVATSCRNRRFIWPLINPYYQMEKPIEALYSASSFVFVWASGSTSPVVEFDSCYSIGKSVSAQ